jgi:hypothetical protein
MGDVLRDMLRTIDSKDLWSYRDRALLTIGMAGAFRRSDLVAITMGRVSDDYRRLLICADIQDGSGGPGGIAWPLPMSPAGTGATCPGLAGECSDRERASVP